MRISHTGVILIIIGQALFSGLLYSEDTPLSLLNAASKCVDNGQYKGALALYLRMKANLAQISDSAQARIYNNMGFCAYKMRKPKEAMDYYLMALERDSDYVTCLNNIAALLMNHKLFSEALVYLRRADSLNHENIKVIINLAICFGHLRNEYESKACLRRAFDLNEDYTYRRLKSRHVSDKDILRLKERLGLPDTKK